MMGNSNLDAGTGSGYCSVLNSLLVFLCIPVGLTIVLGAAPLVQDPPRATANNLPDLALEITDYAALPMTGSPDGAGNNAGSLARLNVMREEPGGLQRFFVNDLTGPLYILDRKTRKATTYLDFNGRGARTGLFDKLPTDAGLASGFISFEFDPDYGRNGRFYTIHLEEIALPGALGPDNASVPGLKVAGYTPTTPIPTPGAVDHEGVIVEWTDSNVNNATFEGTARELMRIPLNGRIHPLGDLSFNPVARRGDPDWRVLYVACGDGDPATRRPRFDSTRSASTRSSARCCGSFPICRSTKIEAWSATTAVIAFRATTRSCRSPGRGRKSGRTDCAILIDWDGTSIRHVHRARA